MSFRQYLKPENLPSAYGTARWLLIRAALTVLSDCSFPYLCIRVWFWRKLSWSQLYHIATGLSCPRSLECNGSRVALARPSLAWQKAERVGALKQIGKVTNHKGWLWTFLGRMKLKFCNNWQASIAISLVCLVERLMQKYADLLLSPMQILHNHGSESLLYLFIVQQVPLPPL